MNELAISILYDYMLYKINILDSKILDNTINIIQNKLSREQFLEIEPYINEMLGNAEFQGFKRAIELFVNNHLYNESII